MSHRHDDTFAGQDDEGPLPSIPPPGISAGRSLCDACNDLFCSGGKKMFLNGTRPVGYFDREARRYQISKSRCRIQSVYDNQFSCWLCARIWQWLRILGDPTDRLSTDAEVFASRFDARPGFFTATWEIRSCHFIQKEGYHPRLFLNISEHSKGPSFEIFNWRNYKLQVFSHIEDFQMSRPEVSTEARMGGSKLLLDRYSDDNRGFSEAVSFLQKGLGNTKTTFRGAPTSKGPRRLIHVGINDTELRLVKTLTLKLKGIPFVRYATLSHCWGQRKPLMLTKSNFNNLLKKIPEDGLNQTFRDTISLCRFLGIRYLWIDCLCIIQGSEGNDDWLDHAPNMSQVYGHSLVNFAASASVDGEEGLFHQANPQLSKPIGVRMANGLLLGEECAPDTLDRGVLYQQHRRLSPLKVRGWVLQELYFSPRTAHFTGLGLTWAAQEHILPNGSTSNDDLFDFWRAVVEEYSATKTTYTQDRSFALASLAAHMAQLLEWKGIASMYAAGCWNHNIVNWLFFRPMTSLRHDEPADIVPEVPSWSWLAYRHAAKVIWTDHSAHLNTLYFEPLRQAVADVQICMELGVEKIPFSKVHSVRIRGNAGHFRIAIDVETDSIGDEIHGLPYTSCTFMPCHGGEPADAVQVPNRIVKRDESVPVRIWMDHWPTQARKRSGLSKKPGKYEFECLLLFDQQALDNVSSYYALVVARASDGYGSGNSHTFIRCGLMELLVIGHVDPRTESERRACIIIKTARKNPCNFQLI